MECKMSFFKYRVMKRLFLFAVCAWAGLSLWASSVKGQGTACETRSEKVPAKVYMIKEISPENLMKVYEALGRKATGKVAVKLSTGEPGNNNYLDPALIKGLVQKVDGTIVECNTAYGGGRSDTEKHLKAAKDHGFTAIAPVVIMDADGEVSLPVKGFRWGYQEYLHRYRFFFGEGLHSFRRKNEERERSVGQIASAGRFLRVDGRSGQSCGRPLRRPYLVYQRGQ